MARQWHSSQASLAQRAWQQWLQGATALFSLAGSFTPAQAATHGDALVQATARGASTMGQLTGVAARIAREGPCRSTQPPRRTRGGCWPNCRPDAAAFQGCAGTSVTSVISDGAPKRFGGPQ